MLRTLLFRLFATALAACLFAGGAANAQNAGPRLALVIGNAQYADPLATAANDAGLIAETLRGAGFDVTGAANLDQESLRRAFQDFLGKATQAGPDAIVFVYLAGRGLQYAGDNYFAPIDANIQHDTDIPMQALRLADFTRALAGIPLRARIVVVDAARGNHFAPGGNLAGGLALVEADPGSLYAFNAAPGTIAPDEPGPYGAYAQALAEMLRQGGVPIDVAFGQARLRANEATKGAVTPWDAANITPPLILLEAAPNAAAAETSVSYAAAQSRPIASFPANEAYAAALERDTMEGYQDFLIAYPGDPLAGRVRALLAARREALTWRRTLEANTPDACWSYMRRYPKGPHYYDARRRLEYLSAPMEPPPSFEVYDFGGLPPPPPPEIIIIDRPVIIFDPEFYPPPPPPPVFFLPPQPVAFIDLAPPPPPPGPGFLPIPIPVPVPFGRFNGPQGRVIQQNFGQQGARERRERQERRERRERRSAGSARSAGAPGAPEALPMAGRSRSSARARRVSRARQMAARRIMLCRRALACRRFAHPGAKPAHRDGAGAPAATNPGGPNHALPQGAGLPAAGPRASAGAGARPRRRQGRDARRATGAGAPGHTLPQGAGLPAGAHPGAARARPRGAGRATPAAPTGAGAPGHALPQGAGLPAGAHPGAAPGAPGEPSTPKPGATPSTAPGPGAPSHTLPQGAGLPPVPQGLRPCRAQMDRAQSNRVQADRLRQNLRR